eukprot:TRINITY_DN6010_c0_g3_i2.p1 TRINITY_DN6010_c0_g3~~TRINITY_DN6010_c0_g3_i2.p1  ORF type:complete len:117 (+),score=11.61 TRINITY_DN6010_c0_g3_i2:74-424(+)
MARVFLRIPKCVEIRNHRVNFVYWFMMVGVVVWITYRFIWGQAWFGKLHLGHDQLHASILVHRQSYEPDNMQESWLRHLDSDLCKTPELYDFWFDNHWRHGSKQKLLADFPSSLED